MAIVNQQPLERLARRLVVIAILSFTAISGAKAQQQVSPNEKADRDRGIQLYKQGNTKGAIAQLRIAAKKNKTDAEVWYYMGLALTSDRQFKEASTAFESALQAQPNLAKARAGLAFTLLLRNKLKEALTEGQQTLVSDPKLVDAHYVVGVVYLRSGEPGKALEHANATIGPNPGYARGYLLKSQALVALSDESFAKDMSREKLLATYKDAVASMEKYLQLSADKTADAVWREQLEAFKSTKDLIETTGRTILRSSEVSERARVRSKPEPVYTESARQNGVSGTVVLRAVFAADGKVKHISVIAGLPDGLTERAVAAAREIKFTPAKKDGRPVSMWMQLEYNFNLY